MTPRSRLGFRTARATSKKSGDLFCWPTDVRIQSKQWRPVPRFDISSHLASKQWRLLSASIIHNSEGVNNDINNTPLVLLLPCCRTSVRSRSSLFPTPFLLVRCTCRRSNVQVEKATQWPRHRGTMALPLRTKLSHEPLFVLYFCQFNCHGLQIYQRPQRITRSRASCMYIILPVLLTVSTISQLQPRKCKCIPRCIHHPSSKEIFGS
jgi:hypothetical protein